MLLQGIAAAELKVIVHLRVLLSLCGWSCSSCGNPCSCIAPHADSRRPCSSSPPPRLQLSHLRSSTSTVRS